MKKALTIFIILGTLLSLTALGAAASDDVEVYQNQSTFISATGAESVPFPASATVLPYTPFASNLTDYSCEDNDVGITLGTGEVTVTAPNANNYICFIGPGWNAGLNNTNPTPVSPTIVANAEDDYTVFEFENPVFAIGFKLLTNSQAIEEITLTFDDGSTAVYGDSSLGTTPNTFEFVGFKSKKAIVSVGIDTTGGAVQNEGISAIWINDVFLTLGIDDCSYGTYEGYLPFETYFVPAYAPGSTPPSVITSELVPGINYLVEASGVFYAGGNSLFDIRADAEYSQDQYQRDHNETWTIDVRGYVGYGEQLLDLILGGFIVDWGDGYNPGHVYTEPWIGTGSPLTLQLQIYDIYASNNTGGLCVTIFEPPNQPPVADPNGPYVVAVNSSISFDGTLSYDPDNDPLTYNWDFMGTDQSGSIVIYTAPSTAGIYPVTLTVDDERGGTDTASTSVIVYDPSAGFVTGGGWINSPAEAYKPDPLLTGKATFGFVSKYKKGADVPEGNTEFQFKAGDLNFHSDHYKWLVVTGSNYAKFMGKGTINGLGIGDDLYRFQIWAGDKEPDTFRIKIWYEEDGSEVVVYDNGMDQEIGGGNIVIHTKK